VRIGKIPPPLSAKKGKLGKAARNEGVAYAERAEDWATPPSFCGNPRRRIDLFGNGKFAGKLPSEWPGNGAKSVDFPIET
jgi:hypothetical protein